MSERTHSLHVAVGDLFMSILSSSDCRVIRDEASGGDQRIPLFLSERKSRKTEFCNVDLLVLKEGKIRIIVEIEESDVGPTRICGKFLTSALSRFYIHESESNIPIRMHDSVKFVQIANTSGLEEDVTSKFEQWKNLEKAINSVLPLGDSKIQEYRLFYGDTSFFRDTKKCRHLVNYLKKEC